MSSRQSTAKRRAVTASLLLDAVADNLSAIKDEDRLTWKDIGEVLHRSPDQAAKYADGSATMDFVAFARGKIAWGKRFTSGVDVLLENASEPRSGQEAQSCILKAALAFSVALEDGEIEEDEIRSNRSTLENARDAIDAQLARLKPSIAA